MHYPYQPTLGQFILLSLRRKEKIISLLLFILTTEDAENNGSMTIQVQLLCSIQAIFQRFIAYPLEKSFACCAAFEVNHSSIAIFLVRMIILVAYHEHVIVTAKLEFLSQAFFFFLI